MKEYYVYWKKKDSDDVKETFIVAEDVESAWNKIFLIKGGRKKVDILYAQEVNRGENVKIGEPVYFE